MSVLTLADAKTHLNITVATWDAELQTFIDAAEAAIAKRCGPLASTATTSVVDGGGTALPLPVSPVITLTSVTASTGEVVTLSDLSVLPPGLVKYTAGAGSFSAPWYTVVYNAGRATCPADLLLAVKELVRHTWASQRGGGTRPGKGGDADKVMFAAQVGAFPASVTEKMDPYLQPGFA